MFSGNLFRILPESPFVPDLDRLPPEEECRADVVHVHQEGRAHQLEGLSDPLGIVDDLKFRIRNDLSRDYHSFLNIESLSH